MISHPQGCGLCTISRSNSTRVICSLMKSSVDSLKMNSNTMEKSVANIIFLHVSSSEVKLILRLDKTETYNVYGYLGIATDLQ